MGPAKNISDPPVEATLTQPGGALKGSSAGWARLSWLDRYLVALVILVLAGVTIPQLPPGICYGDSGGLQLASATLGITHPPGYAGYVSLGFIVTLVPGANPAYMVSLLCLAAGLAALLLCILMQVRLGVPPGLAGAVALCLTAHPRIWGNLLSPEVYMPSLAFLAASAYWLVKYARLGRRRDLLLAGLLFGFVLANRPPAVLTLPFFLLAWWFAARKQTTSWRRSIYTLLLAAGAATAPGVYSLGYLWVRDTAQTPFNYIEQYNDEFRVLPETRAGASAKLERVVWHATGRQFHDRLGNTWAGVRLKLIWLRNQLLPAHSLTLTIGLIIAIFGAVVAFRRCPCSTLLLVGFAVASVVFVCAYRVIDAAADLLPLLFAVGVFSGAALSSLFTERYGSRAQLASALILAAAAVFTVFHAPRRYPAGRAADARPYLTMIEWQTLPKHTMICSSWFRSCPLWYAQHVLGRRPDIEVINATPGNWPQLIAQNPDRPVFTTTNPGHLEGLTADPRPPLWRVQRSAP